jgi:hypothetical protein
MHSNIEIDETLDVVGNIVKKGNFKLWNMISVLLEMPL